MEHFVYADKGEEPLQPAVSGACVNCLCASEKVSVRQSCKILRLISKRKLDAPLPHGFTVPLASRVFSFPCWALWCSRIVLLMTLSVKPALE